MSIFNDKTLLTYNWISTIHSNILVFRLYGLWPEDGIYKLNFHSIRLFLLFTCFLCTHWITQGINIYFTRKNLEALTGTIYVFLLEALLLMKIYSWISTLKVLKQMLDVLNTEKFQPRNQLQVKMLNDNSWLWKLIYKAFIVACIATHVFWCIYPLINDLEFSDNLPFLAWYPYDVSKTPAYQFTFVYQMFSVSLFTVINVNVDTFVTALIMFTGSLFDMLCDNIRNVHKLGRSMPENINFCIEQHKAILSFSEKCTMFLNWILFMQFFVSSISIGLSMFQLSLVKPFSNQFFSVVGFISAIIMQIFMFCLFGNEAQEKSANMSYAIFESNWVGLPLNSQKDLLFFMLRSQRVVRFSAFNLIELNLATFISIIKTAWSYYTVLSQVNI